MVTLTHTASGGGYDSVTATLPVAVEDDESAELAFDPADLKFTHGSAGTYDLHLTAQPRATVTVTISGHAGTSLTLDKTSLTFTTSNWNTPQRVTVDRCGG